MTPLEHAKHYLSQLPPHVKEREAARVIERLMAEVERLQVTSGQCPKCRGTMKPSKAMEMEYSGSPDFANDGIVCTVSHNGKGHLISCMKCEQCGFSVTK